MIKFFIFLIFCAAAVFAGKGVVRWLKTDKHASQSLISFAITAVMIITVAFFVGLFIIFFF